VNDSFARWLGLDRDSILGHNSWELGMWPNLEARRKFWADLRRDGSLREVECQFRTRRGTLHTVLVSADIVEVNREQHMLGFFVDITERKRVENELLRTVAREKELGQLRSNFVSMVSHEFRTPLGIEGIGIPEADREWLFTAFHRGHNVDDRPGTGLGLVIVKRCVDLHGGKISVESKFGEGTSLTVQLPILSRAP
jgi:PAS domain S-box-containing protein